MKWDLKMQQDFQKLTRVLELNVVCKHMIGHIDIC